jgi:hypothetical protein
MHAQLITYQLKDMREEDYAAFCAAAAPAIAQQPGLIAKIWLANPEANVYGGMYTWRDRQSMEAFMHGDLVASLGAHPNITNIRSQNFPVNEAPTRATGGLAAASA